MNRLRKALLLNAVFHVGIYLLFAVGVFGILAAAVISMVGAVASGVYLATFQSVSPGRSMVGILACIAAFIGWGSWPVIWWMDHDLSGPIINITFLLAVLAVPVFLAAAGSSGGSRR